MTLLSSQLAKFFVPESGDRFDLLRAILERLNEQQSAGDSCILLDGEEQNLIKESDLVGEGAPFVLEDRRLYMQRYWLYEEQLAQRLRELANTLSQDGLDIDNYFTDEYQREAAQLVLRSQLSIITGGPGTGKTTTVVKILALLLQQSSAQERPLNIALSAPTGKAAMRLQESIEASKRDSEVNGLAEFAEELIDSIPSEARTIHRLLGVIPNSIHFRHNATNPLGADVVLVDEASMVDLALMSKLLAALKSGAKLILIGDQDQLSSVESGAVLSDCYQALHNNRVQLQNSYRFGGAIKELATAINHQNSNDAISVLQKNSDSVVWLEMGNSISKLIKDGYSRYVASVAEMVKRDVTVTEQDIVKIFEIFNSFQILTATRQGRSGVDGLNRLCETILLNDGSDHAQWYQGRPIMVVQNDHNLGLFNGDIGVHLNGAIYFLLADGVRSFSPLRIPQHETSYAMTIHKSQGSEFGEVLLILDPSHSNSMQENANDSVGISNLLSKELLYTAVTRAKKRVIISASETLIRNTINNSIQRISGLKEKLNS